MAKKTFSTGVDALLGGIMAAETQAPERPAAATLPQGGRPTAGSSSASKKGLQPGLTRMTFIVRQELQEHLKYCALKSGSTIREILDQAIQDYLDAWEKENGKIDIWD